MTDEKSLSELIFDSGRFVAMLIFSLGFLLLVWELSQGMEKMDWSKVDPTQIANDLVIAITSIAASVVAFYFGTRKGKSE